jgi:hypothetical protein
VKFLKTSKHQIFIYSILIIIATMPARRPSDTAVSKHFNYKLPKLLAKCWTAICKLCGGYNAAKSIEQERKHLLDKCP